MPPFTSLPPGTAPASAAAPGRGVECGRIVSHRRVAERIHRIRVECPAVASRARSGQFAMLRLTDRVDPLLGRALAFYDTYAGADDDRPSGDPASHRYADFVYAVHGRFTSALSRLHAGETVSVCGPLGNGWAALPEVPSLLLVAGGIGQTSLLTVGRERAAQGCRVTFCWGAASAGAFADLDDFRRAGLDVRLATLDGSAGTRGTVVDLLDALAQGDEIPAAGGIACCGPDGMMAAVSRWAARRGLPCHVSLEAPMACGIGICFTCVARVRDGSGGWDYRRTCVEGPVFDGASIEWD